MNDKIDYSVTITGIWVRVLGNDLVISVSTTDNRDVVVIKEFCPYAPPISHAISGIGIKNKIEGIDDSVKVD